LAGRNSVELLPAHTTGQNDLHPTLWTVALMKVCKYECCLPMASIMSHDGTSTFSERSRLYVASGAIRISTILLWLARRLYRARLLTFADIRYALRVGETLRRLAWRLMRWNHH
jgi:hypothetical protein